MKIVNSSLIQQDFFIVKTNYEFIEPTIENVNVTQLFSEYEVDFDFQILKQKNGQIYIFVKVEINYNKTPLPGYKMFAEGVSIFDINSKAKLTVKQKNDLIGISGLSIAINNLRSYLNNMTMYFPFGKYTLPTMDLNPLYKAKNTKQRSIKNKK